MVTSGGASSNRFFRLLRFYNHLLNRYKYPVQIATGGFLWGSGDLLCQTLVTSLADSNRHPPSSDPHHNPHHHTKLFDKSTHPHPYTHRIPIPIDWERTARMTIYGLCFSAPTFAFWYSFLDLISHRAFAVAPPGTTVTMPKIVGRVIGWWRNRLVSNPAAKFGRAPLVGPHSSEPATSSIHHNLVNFLIPGSTLRTWKIIGFKLAADTLVFDPLYLSLFFTMTSKMEGKSLAEIGEKLRKDLLHTWLVDMAVWMPIQTVNFRFVPVVYQALVVQSCNIGWNAYLSYVQHRQ